MSLSKSELKILIFVFVDLQINNHLVILFCTVMIFKLVIHNILSLTMTSMNDYLFLLILVKSTSPSHIFNFTPT